MTTFHEWCVGAKRYRAVYDEDHQTRGSYAYDTEAETRAAEDEEIANLRSGRWVVLGVIVMEKKPHCDSCHCPFALWPWTETDSFWGIVVDNAPAAIEAFVRNAM